MTADPTIGVCGFGRCGSTMVMAMLDAGGLPPAPGSTPGAHEHPLIADAIAASTARRPVPPLDLGPLDGHAVKLLDIALHSVLPPATSWSFVWLDRDPVQQALSAVELLVATDAIQLPDTTAGRSQLHRLLAGLVASYRRDRPVILGKLRRFGHVEVLSYDRILANPRRAARTLAALYPPLDRRAAAAVVQRRTAQAQPDLTTELEIAAEATTP